MRQKRQRGATIAEAAVTIMVLFTLLFAIVEFGRAFNMYQVITDAAREGARYSVAPDPNAAPAYSLPTPDQVAQRVCNYLQTANVPPAPTCTSNATACGTWAGAGTLPTATQPGVYVMQNCVNTVNNVQTYYTEVDVKVPYQFLFFPFRVNLTTRAVMRNEATDPAYYGN